MSTSGPEGPYRRRCVDLLDGLRPVGRRWGVATERDVQPIVEAERSSGAREIALPKHPAIALSRKHAALGYTPPAPAFRRIVWALLPSDEAAKAWSLLAS
jgi:hypothetical protein